MRQEDTVTLTRYEISGMDDSQTGVLVRHVKRLLGQIKGTVTVGGYRGQTVYKEVLAGLTTEERARVSFPWHDVPDPDNPFGGVVTVAPHVPDPKEKNEEEDRT